MAEAFRHDDPPTRADQWSRRITGATALVREAELAIGLSRESSRMNVRRSAVVLRTPADRWETVLANLRGSWPYLAEIAQAARTTTDQVRPFEYPDPATRWTS